MIKQLITWASFTLATCSAYALPLSQLPGWTQDDLRQVLAALQQSCQVLQKRNNQTGIACKKVLALPATISNTQLRQFLEENYHATSVPAPPETSGLFTGYYEPQIPGSLTKTARYPIPIYGLPRTYKRVKDKQGRTIPMWKVHGRNERLPTRAEISAGPRLPDTPILAWVPSKVDRFFLEIQGSGSILLPDGHSFLLGYAGQNGQKYYAIGRYLIKIGALDKHNVSLQTIKAWLEQHPEHAEKVMNLNPSFVFFRNMGNTEPIGAQGVPLTPGRSLAVDPRYIRYGSLLWLSTYWPKREGNKIGLGAPLNRAMVAQDTGGAIKGPIRGDIFWGSGKQAEWLAGHMQAPGKLWLLEPN